MTSLPGECASNAPEGRDEDWIAEDHARSLAATVERLRVELEQARADHARAMAESEGRYWALAESLQDILIVLDGSGAPANVAGGTMGILGYAHDEIKALGPSLWERLIHPRDLPAIQACLRRVRHDELPQRLLARNPQRRPGNIVDSAGFFVDEMMMRGHPRLEHHHALLKHLRLDQALLDQQVQRIVNSRARKRGTGLPNMLPHLVRRRVRRSGQNVLGHRDTLRRRLYAVFAQNRHHALHVI